MSKSGRENDLTIEGKHELCQYKDDQIKVSPPGSRSHSSKHTLAQFMSQHPDECGAEAELIVEQGVARPLKKMVMGGGEGQGKAADHPCTESSSQEPPPRRRSSRGALYIQFACRVWY